jgi:hypothetical protein
MFFNNCCLCFVFLFCMSSNGSLVKSVLKSRGLECVECEALFVGMGDALNFTTLSALQQSLEKACFLFKNNTRLTCIKVADDLAQVIKTDMPPIFSNSGPYPIRVMRNQMLSYFHGLIFCRWFVRYWTIARYRVATTAM